MAKADVQAGRAYVSLYVKTDQFQKALQQAKSDLQGFGSGVMAVGGGIAAAGSAIVGGLAGAVGYFTKVGSDLNDLAARTGISTTALAELGYAAEMTGTQMDSVESGVKKMQKNLGGIGPESKKAIESLEAMGLSMDQLSGLAPEDQFQMIAESIGSIDDPSRKAAAAMAIFGGSGTDLIPMMENIRELRDEARDLGIAPSPESVQAADVLGDAIDRVRKVVGSALFEIGAAVAPMATAIAEGMLSAVKYVRDFIKENKPFVVLVAKIGAAVAAAGGAIVAIGAAFMGAGAVIGGFLSTIAAMGAAWGMLVSVVGAVGAAFSAAMSAIGVAIAAIFSPVGLVVAALVGGVYAFLRFTEVGRTAVSTLVSSVTSLFGNLTKTVTDTFGGIVSAIQAGDLALAGQIAMVGLQLVIQQGLEAINNLFGKTTGKIISQLLSGDLSGAFGTVGSVILDTWAGITSGLVGLMTKATNFIADKWSELVNGITNQILKLASEGGVFGELFKQVTGVDLQAETKRAAKLEAERRKLGLKAQENDIASQIANGTYKDPTVEAIKNRIKDITGQIDEGMQSITDATSQAVEDKVGGQVEQTSENIRKLQQELVDLKRQATDAIEASRKAPATSSESAQRKQFGAQSVEQTPAEEAAKDAFPSPVSGGVSVAANNLRELQTVLSSPQARQIKLAEEASKQRKEQILATQELGMKLDKLGLYHA